MKKSYSEKLQDPRWQRKRLEIMEKAGFKCELCECSDEMLQIHHGYYDRRLDPWQYDNETLWCLCKGCHMEVQASQTRAQKQLAMYHPSDLVWMDYVLESRRANKDQVLIGDLDNHARVHLGKLHNEFVRLLGIAIFANPEKLFSDVKAVVDSAIEQDSRWKECNVV